MPSSSSILSLALLLLARELGNTRFVGWISEGGANSGHTSHAHVLVDVLRWVRQLRTHYVCALHAHIVCLIRAAVPCAYACCPLWNSANVRVLPFRPDKSMTRRADETERARQVRHDHARDTGPLLVWAIRYDST